MIKKILLSLAIFGFVFGSPILASAQSFTSLKTQMFDLGQKIENFKIENKGEVLGANSTSSQITKFEASVSQIPHIPYDLTLSWESINSDQCQWISVGGDLSAHAQWPVPFYKALNGSQTITNMQDGASFGLRCRNSQNGTYSRKDIDIPFKPVLDFKANPTIVPFLGSTTLTWDSNVNLPFHAQDNYCKASGDWSGVKDVSGQFSVTGIKTDKTFKLDCFHEYSGYYSKTVYVKVAKVGDIPDPDKDTGGLGSDGPGLVSNNPEVSKITSNNTCSTFSFKRTLSYGSKDTRTTKDVTLMQSILVDEGLMRASDATGSFYSRTQLGLRAFQKKYNLTQTGRFDTKTMAKMNDLFKEYCSN